MHLAIESAGGLGYLLAQQLVDAGEHVLDVPTTLAARIRVLDTKRSDKNDPNDARSIAIAALRSAGLRAVVKADHAELLRLLSRRNHDLGQAANQARLVASTQPSPTRKHLIRLAAALPSRSSATWR